ncbi:MAG: N-acetylmuramoyl-L-alanine amidase [Jatrophihabitans sp.]
MRILLGLTSVTAALLLAGCTAAPRASTAAPQTTGVTPARSTGSVPASTIALGSPVPTRVPLSSKPAARPSATGLPTGSATSHPATATRPPADTVIVLNPGHNGADAAHTAELRRQVPAGFGQYKDCETTGTETNAGFPEHAFNWDVSLRVRALLQARGVRVIMTRDSDTGFGPCVDQRARTGNQAGVAAVVSIHADGAATTGHGFHVCEDSRQPAGAAVAAASHRLTVAMHDALLHGSGMTVSSYLGTNGYFPRDDLAGLNLATVPATFLEIGNMRNGGDAAIQTSAAGRQRIAEAVAAGILSWLGRR